MKAPFSRLDSADFENMRDKANAKIAHKMAEGASKKETKRALAERKRADKARRKRRARARHDFAYFCKTYMPHAFTCDFAPYQEALSRVVSKRTMTQRDQALFKSLTAHEDHGSIVMPQEAVFDGILDLEPRDHGKTTRNTKALPLWVLLNHPEQYVIVGAASSPAAKKIIAAIRTELETNQLLIEDYGLQIGKKWTQSELVLANGNAVEGVGRGQALRGTTHGFLRPTLCILDDLIKDDEKDNRDVRDKTEDWFDAVILSLGQGMLIVVANTILHHDDLPSRLLMRIREGMLPDWLGLVFSAITPQGKPLFPSRWTLKALKKKRLILRRTWWAEWMNKPRTQEEQDFKEEWFQHFYYHDIDIRDCDIMMAVDPATGLQKGDYSAIAIVARNRITMIDYVLFCNGWRESDLTFAKRIVDKYLWCQKTFNKAPKKILFEEVTFQRIYKKEVLRYSKAHGVRLPIKGYKPKGDKKKRIKSLSPDVESGGIKFLANQLLLKSQLVEFPKGHDDCPDALEMCCDEFETKQFAGGASPNALRKIQTGARRLKRLVSNARGGMY